jgi:antitoxin MazE
MRFKMETQTKIRDIKLIPIGNSQGIRLPKILIQKYDFNSKLLIEETEKGLLLRKKNENKLSWADTYKQIGQSSENWDDFDVTLLDGLEDENIDT